MVDILSFGNRITPSTLDTYSYSSRRKLPNDYIIVFSIVIIVVVHIFAETTLHRDLPRYASSSNKKSSVVPEAKPHTLRPCDLQADLSATPPYAIGPEHRMQSYLQNSPSATKHLSHRATNPPISLHCHLRPRSCCAYKQTKNHVLDVQSHIQNPPLLPKPCTKSRSDHPCCAVFPDFEDCSMAGFADQNQPLSQETRTTAMPQTS